jgi:photosystem II stability/assembly factor-like uncharacterized protein
MKRNLRQFFVATLMGLLMLSLTSLSVLAQGLMNPLDRPAMASGLADKSALLAVTAAGKRLVAVGERGNVVLSDDNGASWRQASVPVSVTLTAVRFITPEKGWALGHSGVVLYSNDGGKTWAKQLDGKQAAQLVFETVQAGKEAFGANAEELDRALAAAELLVNDGPDKPFLDMYFENEQRGFVVGAYNLIFLTEDGGKTWQPWQDHVDNPRGMHLYGIESVGKDLFIAGEQGLILRSDNKGQTFTALSSPYEGSFFGLLPLEGDELLVFGLRGHAFKSVDHGATWEAIEMGVSHSIAAAVQLHDGALVVVTQTGDVLASSDKGMTFKRLPVSEPFPFADLIEAENGKLVLVGSRGVKAVPTPCKKLTGLTDTADGERK